MHRLLAGLLLLLALPAGASAAVRSEIYSVPTVGGATINVEVAWDDRFGKVPVVLTYSPYNTIRENGGNIAERDPWIDRGYARAYADVIGTRASTGCWDYGGAKETQSGVDVVRFLAAQPWSNGNVGMIGASYDGTTATMVAAQGDRVPELKAIIPISAISRWYGYAYYDGVRYFLNSEAPADEGFDTPLAFDFGFGLTTPLPDHQAFAAAAQSRVNPCERVLHTEKGYDRSPDYDAFWRERDYLRRAADFRAAVLVGHGWQDYNVKQDEGVALFEALREDDPATPAAEGVPLKRMFLTQGTHGMGTPAAWTSLQQKFFAHFLKGEATDIATSPAVQTIGRTVSDSGGYTSLPLRGEASWPPAGTRDHTLWIRRSFDQDLPVPLPPPGTGETGTLEEQPNNTTTNNIFTWVDTGAVSEELTTRDPLNGPGHGYYSLFHQSAPLEQPLRMAGRAVLDAWVRTGNGATLTPVLVDVTPGGTLKTVARGFLNVDYRDGLEQARPAGTSWVRARVTFLPQDVTFPAKHRIGLLLQSSNTVWALPGTPAGAVNMAMGRVENVTPVGSKLILPVVP